MHTRERVRGGIRRLIGVSLASVLALSAAGTTMAAPTDGLLLIGADGAYARFVAPIDACHGLELFVGYVRADGLKAPLNDGKPRFHTDVEAQLAVYENADIEGCGSDSMQLVGVRGIDEGDTVSFVTLTSATLEGYRISVSGFDGESAITAELVVDVAWTGDGDVIIETSHERGRVTAHRTVRADVDGMLAVDAVTGDGELAAALAQLVGAGPVSLEQTDGILTNYQELQLTLP